MSKDYFTIFCSPGTAVLFLVAMSCCTAWQDDLPAQVNPSPVYPGRQAQLKLPTLLVQLA